MPSTARGSPVRERLVGDRKEGRLIPDTHADKIVARSDASVLPQPGRRCLYISDFQGLGSAIMAVEVLRAVERANPLVRYTYPANAVLQSTRLREASGLGGLLQMTEPCWRRFDESDWPAIAAVLDQQRVDTFVNFRNPDLAADPRYLAFQKWYVASGRTIRWVDLYDEKPRNLTGLHAVSRMTRVLQRAGVPCTLLAHDEWLKSTTEASGARPRIGLFCSASTSTKRWPRKRWSLLGRALCREGNAVTIVAGTSPDERQLAASLLGELRSACPEGFTDLVAPVNIDDLVQILQRLTLLVSNDTGVGHVATACGVPTISLFLSTDARVWGPRGSRTSHIQSAIGMGCPLQRPAQGNCTLHYGPCVAPCRLDPGWDQVAARVAQTVAEVGRDADHRGPIL